jgi:TPR repeat protein
VLITMFFVSTAVGQMTLRNMGLKPAEARKCALHGDADCQARLGMFYEDGSDGVLEDHAEAIMWYRKAADQGLVAAEMALASIYEHG